MQSIRIDVPQQANLAYIDGSDELVLYILTGNDVRPFSVYKHMGVNGFQRFFESATLPPARYMALLDGPPTGNTGGGGIKLISIFSKYVDEVYLVEPVTN